MNHSVIGNDIRDGLKTHGIGKSATKSSSFIVYKLTNTVNGKSYIGISNRAVNVRWFEHTGRAREGQRKSRLYDAIRKYGPEAFTREVIATSDSEDGVRELEKVFIQKFDTYENGYNSNLGGHGFLHFPEHIKRKIGDAQKGKYIPPETRAKMAAAKRGRKEFANHFGAYVGKGADSPLSRRFRLLTPAGEEIVVTGLRKFCRDNGLHDAHLKARGHSKGYKLLERLND